MPLDILTFGEALVEVMRTEVGRPLSQPAPFTGPYPSGAPFIFAVQAARLGVSVGAIGAVGDDAFGQCLTDQLSADGVDVSGVAISKTKTTGVAFVAYNHDGSRDFIYHIADSAAGELHPDMLDEEMFMGLRVLHLMGSTLSIHEDALLTGFRAMELAKAAGAKISFDPNLRPELMPGERAASVFEPIVEGADVIIPTEEEACLLTGQASVDFAVGDLLTDNPERVIVVTQGEAGCTVYTGDGSHRVPGFDVDEVDPTGAGDCFDAGFLVRWLLGDDVQTAARYANACGALAVTEQGPMAGAKLADEVEAFMAGSA